MVLLMHVCEVLFMLAACCGRAAAAAAATSERSVVVAVAANATPYEIDAGLQLADMVGQILGMPGPLQVVSPADATGKAHFAVGFGAAVAIGIPPQDLDFSIIGPEGFVASTNRSTALRSTRSVALSGAANSTTGTLYAVYHALQALGVRFFAWDETFVPQINQTISLSFDVTFRPHFEYRAVDGWAALSNPVQARYFHLNDEAHALSAQLRAVSARRASPGGPSTSPSASPYATPPGFVHTSYRLFGSGAITPGADPTNLLQVWNTHRQWFWPRNDSSVSGQLCWSNASLVEYIIQQARTMLSTQPNARIFSISQNDNNNYCQDERESAIIAAEGSPMGPLLRAVNAVADALCSEFPLVAFDTLAYSYSQPPPRITK